MKPTRVEDWPAHMQQQIRAQLGGGSATAHASCGKVVALPQCRAAEPAFTPGVICKSPKKRRQPNPTEMRYKHDFKLPEDCHFEAMMFKLPGGARYTPDWMWWNGWRMNFAEVKGGYRFHSHGRARTAFLECAALYTKIVFHWATWKNNQWEVETYNDETTGMTCNENS